jgi:hypothetical protein
MTVCVLGMHRSGTSLVARLLNILGLDLGASNEFVPPDRDNPTGFWEHRGFVAISDEILQRLGGDWREPPTFPEDWALRHEFDDLMDEARRLIAREFSGAPSWGWKDPRASLTLPFWQRLLPDLHYVICFRNPLEVARSLEVRDALPMSASARLWTTYSWRALRATAGHRRVLVFYEDLLSDAAGEVERIAGALNMAGLGERPDARDAVAAFVDDSLRHGRVTAADVAGHDALALSVRAWYLTLHQRVQTERGHDQDRQRDLDAAIDILGAGLDGAGVVDQLEDDLRLMRARLEEAGADVRRAMLEASRATNRASALAASLAIRTRQARALEARLAAPDRPPPAGDAVATLAGHPLFDRACYARQAGLAEGVDPVEHYLTVGSAQGLSPHPLFDPAFYLGRYPELADLEDDLLLHFLDQGGQEWRWPHPLFDTGYYLAMNPDVAASGENPLAHYVREGARMGRAPHPLFDPAFYVAQQPAGAEAADDPLVHYIVTGARHGWNPNPWFDTAYYRAARGDAIEEETNPLAHFDQYGWREGLNPSERFDCLAYLARYADVRESGDNPLTHFLLYGRAEGRRAVRSGA